MIEMNDKTLMRQKIVLAALLHDIGKFWQRADAVLSRSENMSDYSTGDNAHIVPTFDSRPGYQHALWTHKFLLKNGKVFNRIWPGYAVEEFALLSAKHHRPDDNNIEQAIISMADKWASKNERVFVDFAESEDVERTHRHKSWGKFAYKKIPIHNIFDIVNRDDGHTLSESEKHVYNLAPLSILDDSTIFSKQVNVDPNSSLEKQYASLWSRFTNEFTLRTNKSNSIQQVIATIDALLLEFTWCIPSSTMDMPYASLYQHSKIVAGIAIALYDFYQDNPDNFLGRSIGDGNYGWQVRLKENPNDPLLMVCMDLSGIQKYIYDISTRYAAKALKGRSYNLQLLMKSCINEILYHKDVQLNLCNIVYDSGGKAYLILPNTEKCKKALQNVRAKLESKFFDTYGTLLYPSLGWVSFRYHIAYEESSYKMHLRSNDPYFKKNDNDAEATLGDLWRSVSDEASKYKSRRYQDVILDKEGFGKFFDPQNKNNQVFENLPKCIVTGERKELEHMVSIDKIRDEDDLVNTGLYVTNEVFNQIELGGKLGRTKAISESYNNTPADNQSYVIRPADLDTTYVLNPRGGSLAPEMISYSYNKHHQNHHGTQFYGGNSQPVTEGDKIKSYQDITEVVEGSNRNTHLGVLKMDVDSLGKIFIRGLPDKDKSFSAYATLSAYLEIFFSGYINRIRDSEAYKDFVQIIYSGGDDVFAVGRWDKLVEFAIELNDRFHDFTRRQDLSLSGGLVMVKPKYPISKAADLADEAERLSKSFRNAEKNAFTFFGETISWNKEMRQVISLKDQLLYFADDLSSGFLHRLQMYKIRKDEAIFRDKRDFSYKWHVAYDVARRIEPLKKDTNNQGVIDFLTSIQQNLMTNETFGAERYLDLLGLAARWTEYLLKLKNT